MGTWTFCNYDAANAGFPIDCGKDGPVRGYKFFAMPGTRFTRSVGAATSNNGLEVYTGDDCPAKSTEKRKEGEQTAEKKEGEQTSEKKEGEQTSAKKEGEKTTEKKEAEQTAEKKVAEQTAPAVPSGNTKTAEQPAPAGEQTSEKKEGEQTAEKKEG